MSVIAYIRWNIKFSSYLIKSDLFAFTDVELYILLG